MSGEHIRAGIRLAEQIRLDDRVKVAELTSQYVRHSRYQELIGALVSKYELFGYALEMDDVSEEAFPEIDELDAFAEREHDVAVAATVLAKKYDSDPDTFVPLIVAPTGHTDRDKGILAKLVVADARADGLVYLDALRGEAVVSHSVRVDGAVHDTTASMDRETYQQLLYYARYGVKGPNVPGFDEGGYTALTAYQGTGDGYPPAVSPSGHVLNNSSSLRIKFRPAITVATNEG